MFAVFKRSNGIEKLKKQRALLLEKAMRAQRNGDIRAYSELSFEAEAVYKKIGELETANRS
ncbi:DUF6435 family protein [Agaribacterium haliotis]|uniref:DUF6435 family protein n=1 Tax=Agaribacterium haliotis TaxID=2013869 RepID=UPI000BB5313F|nr:DUF6435 family protein [Agaribacterium haliotis]